MACLPWSCRAAARMTLAVVCACAVPPADLDGTLPAPALDGPEFLEVHAVEASGPPGRLDPQGPPAVRPVEAAEDSDAPASRARAAELELERAEARLRDAERDNAALRARVHDLEARILSLSLERARLEQEVVQLRIDELRAELARLDGAAPSER